MLLAILQQDKNVTLLIVNFQSSSIFSSNSLFSINLQIASHLDNAFQPHLYPYLQKVRTSISTR